MESPQTTSEVSTKTFTSKEEERTFQENYEKEEGKSYDGRSYHNVESSAYWLPRDEDEQLRLTGVRRNNNKKKNAHEVTW